MVIPLDVALETFREVNVAADGSTLRIGEAGWWGFATTPRRKPLADGAAVETDVDVRRERLARIEINHRRFHFDGHVVERTQPAFAAERQLGLGGHAFV